jgi:hypothetical protein
MAIIDLPILYVPDPLKGRPLFNSQIFVGEPDFDPEVVINQKQLNVIQEDGTVVPVAQPFVVGAGGVPVYLGQTVRLDVDGNYSLKILDRLGAQKYFIENVLEGTPITIEEISSYTGYETLTTSDMANSILHDGTVVVMKVGDIIHNKAFSTGNDGGGTYDAVSTSSVTPNTFDIIIGVADDSISFELRIEAGGGVKTSTMGINPAQPDNHTRLERASTLAKALGTFINPDHVSPCLMSETPTIEAPIASDRPIRSAVFEQSDNTKSVLIFSAGMDFFHTHNFTAKYTTPLAVHTLPAISLLGDNHNAMFSNIHTDGGAYGIYSQNAGFFQTYLMCRFENTSTAHLRIDGPSTTVNITNCGGFNNKTTTATACLWLKEVGEVNINTYETGQGKVNQLIVSDSVFNLEITALHWENTEIVSSAFNLSNCSASIRGLYMQNIKIPTATTVPLISNFKSTIQISNITRRDHAPDGDLSFMVAVQAGIMNNSDTVVELSGSIDLDDFTMTGTYTDVDDVDQSITSQQLMRLDAPKTKIFSVSNVAPNTDIAFPFNGSKPAFMQVVLGGTIQGITDIFDGSLAVPTALTGGGSTTNASFRYRWVEADGTLGVANKDIQIICHYPKGWFAL